MSQTGRSFLCRQILFCAALSVFQWPCSDRSSHTYTAHTHFNQQLHTVSWGAVILVMDRSNPWSPRGNRLPCVPPPGSGFPQTPWRPAELSVDGTHRYAPTGEATRTEGEGRGWFRWKGEEEEEIVAIKTVLVLIYSEYVFVCLSLRCVCVCVGGVCLCTLLSFQCPCSFHNLFPPLLSSGLLLSLMFQAMSGVIWRHADLRAATCENYGWHVFNHHPPSQDNEQHLPTAPYVCNMSSQKVLTVPSLLYFVTGGESCWYDANLIIRQSAKEIDVLKKLIIWKRRRRMSKLD